MNTHPLIRRHDDSPEIPGFPQPIDRAGRTCRTCRHSYTTRATGKLLCNELPTRSGVALEVLPDDPHGCYFWARRPGDAWS